MLSNRFYRNPGCTIFFKEQLVKSNLTYLSYSFDLKHSTKPLKLSWIGIKWLFISFFKFYKFIDKHIDKENFDNDEKRDLHKELIRTETSSLGRFNTRKDKRGIRTTKISSRILNYCMSLANKLGKVQYESEAQLRSLPTWDTISR